MRMLDREGVFKAIPISWSIRRGKNGSQSVGINIEYKILAQWNGQDWDDWSGYEEHHVYGTQYIIGKIGDPNQKAIDALANALGWSWDAASFREGPPQVECKITVEAYEGRNGTGYSVQWLNNINDRGPGGGVDDEELAAIDAEFGGLLRAASGASGAPSTEQAPPPLPPMRGQQAPQQAPETPPLPPAPPETDDDLPF